MELGKLYIVVNCKEVAIKDISTLTILNNTYIWYFGIWIRFMCSDSFKYINKMII